MITSVSENWSSGWVVDFGPLSNSKLKKMDEDEYDYNFIFE